MPATEILRLVFGFIAVLGMIGGSAFLARKAGLANLAGASGKKRRLALSESLPLDARRRLAIVRCDDLEYLIVLGPSGETVVASGLAAVTIEDESGDAPAQFNPFAEFGDLSRKLRGLGATSSDKAKAA
ncbi:FliO/MopB family protein [Hyphococcus sp.]|uniref:FliO/MopB family protein n=1 Tax=Hyphococcus sp. TaxID=2038636 RepID=UPI0035C6660A